jgi:hypothetical protein
MKIYPPLYPGESFFHPGTVPGGDVESIWPAAALRAAFVRSNTAAPTRPDNEFDVLGIEQQARAARNAWIAGRLKFYYAAIKGKLQH